MNQKLVKKHIIKVLEGIKIFYCDISKILICIGPLGKKNLKIKTKILICNNSRQISVTQLPFDLMSNNQTKKLKIIQGTMVSLIKQTMLDVSVPFCKKLKLVGVGYRVVPIDVNRIPVFHFKLGFSHQIYFKTAINTKLSCLKFTSLFVFADSYLHLTQTLAIIRSYKVPEPYKGKGILYSNEKILLKEGKKV